MLEGGAGVHAEFQSVSRTLSIRQPSLPISPSSGRQTLPRGWSTIARSSASSNSSSASRCAHLTKCPRAHHVEVEAEMEPAIGRSRFLLR
eukprot:3478535-Pleurochrysis_carterae.AAC.1